MSGSANPLLGSWRLVSCETKAADGSIDYPLGEDAVGLLMYTDDGHMSGSLARADRQPFATGDLVGGKRGEKERVAESYVSYCGRYGYRRAGQQRPHAGETGAELGEAGRHGRQPGREAPSRA